MLFAHQWLEFTLLSDIASDNNNGFMNLQPVPYYYIDSFYDYKNDYWAFVILCFTSFYHHWLCFFNWECNINIFVQSNNIMCIHNCLIWIEIIWCHHCWLTFVLFPLIQSNILKVKMFTWKTPKFHMYQGCVCVCVCQKCPFLCYYMYGESIWPQSIFCSGCECAEDQSNEKQEVEYTTVIYCDI